MLTIAMWIAVGAFVGWNVPQPTYMKTFQDYVTSKWKKFRQTAGK